MSIPACEVDERLLEEVVIDILKSDAALASIPPRHALEEDGNEKGETSLTVQATLSGRSIRIVADYSVTVTLWRTSYQGTTQANLETLWRKVRAKLLAPPAGLPIYAQFSHLDFDDIEDASESDVAESHPQRSLTFVAHMAPAS